MDLKKKNEEIKRDKMTLENQLRNIRTEDDRKQKEGLIVET